MGVNEVRIIIEIGTRVKMRKKEFSNAIPFVGEFFVHKHKSFLQIL